jgi:hypothetical protein
MTQLEIDAVASVSGDEVSCPRTRSADGVSKGEEDGDTDNIPKRRLAGGVRPDVVALDEVVNTIG